MWFLPDPDDHTEMRLVVGIATAFGHSGNEWIFLGLLVLLVVYITARITIAITVYLFTLYSERAFGSSPYVRIFRIVLAVAAVVLIIGVVLIRQETTAPIGVTVLSYGFGVFGVVSAALDWYFSRRERTAAPALTNVNLQNIAQWNVMTQKAKQGN